MATHQNSILRRIFPTSLKLLLDKNIKEFYNIINGSVLVIGSGHHNYSRNVKKSSFLVHSDLIKHDNVEIIMDAHFSSFKSNSFDSVIATEVFEHLKKPFIVSTNIYDLLKTNGILVISIPFMFRIHADPYDYFRYTKYTLYEMFKDFSYVKIIPLGNRLNVIMDIITTSSSILIPLRILNHLLTLKIFQSSSDDCPLLYIIIARK